MIRTNKVWKIKVKGNEFVGNFGAKKPKVSEPKYIRGNGWECKITPTGTIVCITKKKRKILKFVIFKNGFSKLTLKTGKSEETIKQGYVINAKGEPIDGFIGLVLSGKIEERYAFYRSKKFQKFLSMHDIAKIEKENPNRQYVTISAQKDENGEGYFVDIITDGIIEKCFEDDAEIWCEKQYSKCAREVLKIENATWVLTTEAKHNKYGKFKKYSTLHTLENNFNNLEGIPLKEVNN